MNFLVSIILFSTIAGLCLPSGFSVDVCDNEFEVFRFGIQRKCPSSLYPSPPPIEVDGELLDRLMDANHGNAYTSILFYDSRCPFSRAVRPKFDVLTSMFPHIKHLIVEQSQALPSYGIHSLPSVLMMNQTLKMRYHGQKDLASLIQFYKVTTGLKPMQYQYVNEVESTSLDTNDNLITWLHNGSSVQDIAVKEPNLVLSLMFLSLKLAILTFPIMGSFLKTLWALYVQHLSLGILGETSQLFGRALPHGRCEDAVDETETHQNKELPRKSKESTFTVSLGKSSSESA